MMGEGDAGTMLSEPLEHTASPLWIRSAPRSEAAEQIRRVAHRLETVARRGLKRIGITSAERQAGRTSLAANLALAAASRCRVVLVDGDVRRPALDRRLSLSPAVGLAEVALGQATLERALVRMPERVHVLAAGIAPRPETVFADLRVGEILERLAADYDLVIVDLPPTLPFADVAIVAPALDRLLVVIRAGQTRRSELAEAMRILPDDRLLGCVLCRAPRGQGVARAR